ncbi:FAD:protein FMN transferase [Maritalea mediterranea]|uniref:FAD:protein FMN transferase n=1 Tax=Maritalea mediterranea TaxID=2909667 RepID=A0ABS9E6D7_9HYPH|nr:FAD:protein FMN transferase [Maritalea mediterranea]MCF4098435.1 FAD:protein FMN transferase [Maritalea mediterranea]
MITRRRMLSILGGMTALPLMGANGFASPQKWQGIALGAEASIVLDHPDADRLIEMARLEMIRLENIFSLYKGNSQLSQLNRTGQLSAPALELVELLHLSARLHRETGGIFDPTIQPLWDLYAQEYAAGSTPSKADIAATQAKIGMNKVVIGSDQIRFAVPGMGLTFNGIAQGFIADKVTHFLRQEGIQNVLVNTGEIAAMGHAPNGQPWPVTLQETQETLGLADQAIATSAPRGTHFDPAGEIGHILHPELGQPGGQWRSLSVVDASAARADGLSTAFCLMDSEQIDTVEGAHKVLFGAALQS